ncbi:hypothetical protein M8C21_009300, partial [Ambrosia artemisiifolia]
TDTLHQGQQLKDWDELISSNRVFCLKFFSFGTNVNPYLGIFYRNKQIKSPYTDESRIILKSKKMRYRYNWDEYSNMAIDDASKTAVWVANRNNPVPDIYGKLVVDVNGELSVLSGAGTVVDLFNPTPLVIRNASVTLLDSGNLVLRELHPDGSVKQQNKREFISAYTKAKMEKKKTTMTNRAWIWLIILIGLIIMIVSLAVLSSYWVYKNIDFKEIGKKIKKLVLLQTRRMRHFYISIRTDKNVNTELHYFTFQSISSATNNFSHTNMLGKGGFGEVYKGKFVDGQEVAVKRLSKTSRQGVKEFKNETELIAKLQHTNLVRILGCCVEKQEQILPKISDFGMAKLFGINESEANTSRVVGTRGYMPPEYLIDGIISTKIDVFGFGVLLLEIISSKTNHASYDAEHPLNLLGLAWELWNEGRGLELMDPVLEDTCTPK